MTIEARKSGEKDVGLPAIDVGRYLKKLSSLYRDKKTGNQSLRVSLEELSAFLIESKAKSIGEALAATEHSFSDKLEVGIPDPATWDITEIREYLKNEHMTKKALISIGFNRLGIPVSRMEKMGQVELLKTLTAAVDHEESIEILSNQAGSGGIKRTS